MTDPAQLTTFAPEVPEALPFLPTGNLWVSLPEIDRRDGSVHSLGALLERPPGLLQAHGQVGRQLVQPLLTLDGQPAMPAVLRWSREGHWLPHFLAPLAHGELQGWYCAPIDERGVVLRLRYHHTGAEVAVELGWTGAWASSSLVQLRPEPVEGGLRGRTDTWTGSRVVTLTVGLPLLAVAWQVGQGMQFGEDGDSPRWSATRGAVLASDQTLEVDLYLAVAPEPDGAATTALHLRRRGFDALHRATLTWLAEHALRFAADRDDVSSRVNSNLFFNYFYASGDCLDTGTPVLLTSRSPHYYVSGAFWSRDAYCWTFPALLLTDARRARAVLLSSLAAAGPRVADHALYLNGTSLYPGFELDQAAAPVIAVWRYVRVTGDRTVLQDAAVSAALDQLPELVAPWRHPTWDLYGTFLLPTDDPTEFPYVTTCNALLAVAFEALADLCALRPGQRTLEQDDHGQPGEALRARAAAVRQALHDRLVVQGPHGRMWAWSCNEQGLHEVRDEAPLGLRTLPYWGLGSADDPVQVTSRAWLRDGYPYTFAGAFPGAGTPHFPYPSGFDLANRLLDDDPADGDALAQLVRTPMDQGLACESWDPDTGVVRTGAAMASMAGLLAWTAWAHLAGARRWDQLDGWAPASGPGRVRR